MTENNIAVKKFEETGSLKEFVKAQKQQEQLPKPPIIITPKKRDYSGLRNQYEIFKKSLRAKKKKTQSKKLYDERVRLLKLKIALVKRQTAMLKSRRLKRPIAMTSNSIISRPVSIRPRQRPVFNSITQREINELGNPLFNPITQREINELGKNHLSTEDIFGNEAYYDENFYTEDFYGTEFDNDPFFHLGIKPNRNISPLLW